MAPLGRCNALHGVQRLIRRCGTSVALALIAAGGVGAGQESASALPSDGADLARRLVQGPIVVLARVEDSGLRPRLGIEEVLRGPALPETVKLAYRGANLTRPVGTPAFEIEDGERAVFVLGPWVDSRGREAENLYRPEGGYQARVRLPKEGGEALLDAARRIIEFQDSPDRGLAEARLVDWLEGSNPWLIDAALAQAAEYALAGPEWIPALLARARDAAPRRRVWVIRAFAHALERGRLTEERRARLGAPRIEPQERENEHVRACQETLVRLARTDADAVVRSEAVQAIARVGVPEADALLEAIARDDADQNVRYEAAAALYTRRQDGGRTDH
ncbi:MAG: HEAT repeat domain-containing protein [Acidobacteriota bacterium]|nr:MAG: HEAT repeat domain-containing protein [Acidobacteriota bacterium]